jgi:hypothetical protein
MYIRGVQSSRVSSCGFLDSDTVQTGEWSGVLQVLAASVLTSFRSPYWSQSPINDYNDYIYLTAVGLTPGGSSTAHIGSTPGGSSTVHIWLTPGDSSTVHIGSISGGTRQHTLGRHAVAAVQHTFTHK